MNSELKNRPTFNEAFQFWLKLGFISFGGPAGQIAIMHAYIVEQKKWISEQRFMHALNYCMVLPGPEAQQLATYIGWLLHGTKGGLFAGILFVLPSMFILLALSIIYTSFGNIPEVYALFNGLKPAVVAIIIHALFKIGGKSLKTSMHFAVAGIAFVLIYFLNVPFPFIILGAALFSIMFGFIKPEITKPETAINESLLIDESNIGSFKFTSLLRQLFTALMLWVTPLVIFILVSSDPAFWKTLITFFTKAALVTFGGAYAVLPFVAQESVEKLHWLNEFQMLDGLALGETTPGPLIMVLAFVGYMAGYNYFGNSIMMGALGLFTTTYYTFLPCFFFIFAGAPLIEQTRNINKIKNILSFITAAVVGVILNLSVYLAKAILFKESVSIQSIDYFSLAWIIISLFALIKMRVNLIVLIVVSGLAGLLKFLLIG